MSPHRPNEPDRLSFFSLPPVRYPDEYVWLVFVSSLDIIMTWAIMTKFGGREANPLANLYLSLHGFKGLVIFKFCIVTFVVVICEVVGRSDDRRGRWLARVGIGISAIPMVVSATLLLLVIFTPIERMI